MVVYNRARYSSLSRDPVLAPVSLWTQVEACWVAVRHVESRGGREPDDTRDEHFLAFNLGQRVGWSHVFLASIQNRDSLLCPLRPLFDKYRRKRETQVQKRGFPEYIWDN